MIAFTATDVTPSYIEEANLKAVEMSFAVALSPRLAASVMSQAVATSRLTLPPGVSDCIRSRPKSFNS